MKILFPSSDDEKDGFHLELKNGTSTYQCISGLKTLIKFECNSKAEWATGSIDSKWVEVVYNSDDHCQVSCV